MSLITWTFAEASGLLVTSFLVTEHAGRHVVFVSAFAQFSLFLGLVAGLLQTLPVVPTGEDTEPNVAHVKA